MKPFGALIAERSRDLERALREANAMLNRYAGVSGARSVTLEEASWLGAIVFLGVQEAQRLEKAGKVHTIVAEDKVEAKDSAA